MRAAAKSLPLRREGQCARREGLCAHREGQWRRREGLEIEIEAKKPKGDAHLADRLGFPMEPQAFSMRQLAKFTGPLGPPMAGKRLAADFQGSRPKNRLFFRWLGAVCGLFLGRFLAAGRQTQANEVVAARNGGPGNLAPFEVPGAQAHQRFLGAFFEFGVWGRIRF